MALEGVPISPLAAEQWALSAELLRRQNPDSNSSSSSGSSSSCPFLPGGKPPAAGDVFRNPDLADSFRVLGEEGADAFYSGRIGQSIVASLSQRGGLMTLQDLTSHTSTFDTPVSVDYKGVRVWEMPPNGQGITALLALQMLQQLEEQAAQQQQLPQAQSSSEQATAAAALAESPAIAPLASLGHNSAEYLHRVIEVMRLAFADTRFFVCDTAHPDADRPLEADKANAPGAAAAAGAASTPSAAAPSAKSSLAALLSPEYARSRVARLDPSRTQLNHPHGSPVQSSSTVSFVVVDAQGNACSFINSNYMGFVRHTRACTHGQGVSSARLGGISDACPKLCSSW
jgi:gamma-glutamyltranspeptidase/glutathione hydrolase